MLEQIVENILIFICIFASGIFFAHHNTYINAIIFEINEYLKNANVRLKAISDGTRYKFDTHYFEILRNAKDSINYRKVRTNLDHIKNIFNELIG